jgi:hypothetical protein
MRYAIVDNSTLTAVSRLLGHILVQNRYALDGDVAALEGLIQAILFYDRLFFVDDYQEEFREQRRGLFPFLTALKQDDFSYTAHLQAARDLTKDISLIAQNSRIVDDDFRPFIDALRMNTVFTWRMRSSVFWLTVSMLGGTQPIEVRRYSKLWEAISTQLLAKSASLDGSEPAKPIHFVQRDGEETDLSKLDRRHAVDKEIQRFAASMSWLALRTAFYSILAQSSGADVVLHPIRHSFRLNLLRRHLGMNVGAYAPVIVALNDRMHGTVQDIVSATQPIVRRLELPLFSLFLARNTRDIRKILDEALRMRELPLFTEARAQLIELEQAKQTRDFVTRTNRLLGSLDATAKRLREKFGIETKQGVPIAPIVAVANTALQLKTGFHIPDFGLKFRIPGFISRRRDKKGFHAVFRSVVEDLVSIERLGDFRRKLISGAKVKAGARYRGPLQESARWFGRDSSVRRWQ